MFDILSFFRPKKVASGNAAKERLKLVLVHDRTNCSGDLLEKIRKEIMDVLSKYMEIDMDNLDIKFGTVKSESDSQSDVPAFYANIPIKNLRKPIESKTEEKPKEEPKKAEEVVVAEEKVEEKVEEKALEKEIGVKTEEVKSHEKSKSKKGNKNKKKEIE